MEVIEYIVFFEMIGTTLFLYKVVKIPLPGENGYVDESWKCEKRVYFGLKQHDLHAVPQYRVGKCRIDIAFPKQLIAIECDGKAYHSTPKQKSHDRKKDKFLKKRVGWC